jgi:hypothetical protein
LIDYLCERVKEQGNGAVNCEELKKMVADEIVKMYMKKEYLMYLYTPSQMALACLDIALTQIMEKDTNVSEQGACGDLTAVFSEVEISTWDKVGEIKKEIKDYKLPEKAMANKIRFEVNKFHKEHPEFVTKLDDMRKK